MWLEGSGEELRDRSQLSAYCDGSMWWYFFTSQRSGATWGFVLVFWNSIVVFCWEPFGLAGRLLVRPGAFGKYVGAP
jgi:hypothetical protein